MPPTFDECVDRPDPTTETARLAALFGEAQAARPGWDAVRAAGDLVATWRPPPSAEAEAYGC